MKVVLDTNVLISAFAGRGLCSDLFEYCLKEVDLALSDALLDELEDVLSKKFKLSKTNIQSVKKFLKEQCEIVTPDKLPKKVCRDPNDIMVLGTAKAAKADIIITGDEDLLVLKKFEGIIIVSPRDFLRTLSDSG